MFLAGVVFRLAVWHDGFSRSEGPTASLEDIVPTLDEILGTFQTVAFTRTCTVCGEEEGSPYVQDASKCTFDL